MPINAVEEGRLLVLKAARVNRGARNLIREGGTQEMLEDCRREMRRVAADHQRLITHTENRLHSLTR